MGSPVPPRRVAVERKRREITAALTDGVIGSGGGLERLLVAEGIDYRAVSGGDVKAAPNTVPAGLELAPFDDADYETYSGHDWIARGLVDGENRGVAALALDESHDGTGVWRAATILAYDAISALFTVRFEEYVLPPGGGGGGGGGGYAGGGGGAAPPHSPLLPASQMPASRARLALTSSIALAGALGGEAKNDEHKACDEVRGGPTAATGTHASLPRTSICFLAESPTVFARRLGAAFSARRAAAADLRFALAVDCMPTDDAPPLTPALRERVLRLSLAARSLKAPADRERLAPAVETLLNAVQHDWARALNRTVLVSDALGRESVRKRGGGGSASLVVPLGPRTPPVPERALVAIAGGAYGARDFAATTDAFRFRSLAATPAVVAVRQSVASEMPRVWPRSLGGGAGVGLLVAHGGVKSLRLDEFNAANHAAIDNYTTLLRETWAADIRNHLRMGLGGVGKGNFNLRESQDAAYATSKLRRLLRLVGSQMADELRSSVEAQLTHFVSSVETSCDVQVSVDAPNAVTSIFPPGSHAARRAPLFAVDLIVIEEILPPLPLPVPKPLAKGEKPKKETGPPPPPPGPRIQHTLGVSSAPAALAAAPPAAFAAGLAALKGAVTTVERQVMDRLFWSTEPRIPSVLAAEPLPIALTAKVTETLSRAIAPLNSFLENLAPIVNPVLMLNAETLVNGLRDRYAAAASEAGGSGFNLVECTGLIKRHRDAAIAILEAVPSSTPLGGFVVVNAVDLRAVLVKRHSDCADAVVNLMAGAGLDASTSVIKTYDGMVKALSQSTSDIESLTAIKEFISNVPDRLKEAQARYEACGPLFSALEAAHFLPSKEQFDNQWKAAAGGIKVWKKVAEVEKALDSERLAYADQLAQEQIDFAEELNSLADRCSGLNRYTKLGDCGEAAYECLSIKATIASCDERARLFNSREALFGKDLTEYDRVSDIKKAFEPYLTLWESAQSWKTQFSNWMSCPFVTLDAETIEREAGSVSRAMAKSGKTFERLAMDGCVAVARAIKEECDGFMPLIPLITALRNPGMRTRHWAELSDTMATGVRVDPDGEGDAFTLPRVIQLKLADYMEPITKVGERAGKEYQIEVALDKMAGEWTTVFLDLAAYRETGTYVVKGVSEMQALLDEHTTMTQAMSFSAFKKPFAERIDQWASSLMLVAEVMDEWIKVQRSWMYLEPIFSSADIQKQLPTEYKRFSAVDKNWRATMVGARGGAGNSPTPQKVIQFCANPKLLERWQEGNRFLELVQKGLSDYLETKRAGFGRFYFLSNDELLEILSQTKDPRAVQPHLKKCFEGIRFVEFESPSVPTIIAMISGEKEKVALNSFALVDPRGKNVEVWMTEVEHAMCRSVRTVMKNSVDDYLVTPRTSWVQRWPGQCVLNASQLHWTREMEDFIREKGNEGVAEYCEQQIQQLKDMVVLIRGRLDALARITLGSLTVIDVHARDVTKKMAASGVSNLNDFDWISQLRYYWSEVGAPTAPSSKEPVDEVQGDMTVHMISSKRPYGYEYLGNSLRLVITPLTDKCYMTLMGALQMNLGGAPAGPAGTGKTETTKDLAKALAKCE